MDDQEVMEEMKRWLVCEVRFDFFPSVPHAIGNRWVEQRESGTGQ
jgi:hypothetical protein